MVTNVIKGSFPMSKVLVFEGNYFMIAFGKECD